jgi:hypothetical protein
VPAMLAMLQPGIADELDPDQHGVGTARPALKSLGFPAVDFSERRAYVVAQRSY